MQLDLISAGAAKGVVEALSGRFREAHDATIAGTFGAVGAMKEKLLAGAPCDVIVLTQALLDGLATDGHVRGGNDPAAGSGLHRHRGTVLATRFRRIDDRGRRLREA